MDIEQENGLIRAGLAHNAYQLLEQYDSFPIPPEQRYDVTLHLCVLQMLLANSVEFAMTKNERASKAWLAPLQPFVDSLLADDGALQHNTFPGETPDPVHVLTHLRNALSHPRMTHQSPPTTGYTTESVAHGVITHVTFTDSPDYNTKGTPKAPEHRHKRKGNPYVGPDRIFTLRIEVHRLVALTRALANELRGADRTIRREFSLDRLQDLAS